MSLNLGHITFNCVHFPPHYPTFEHFTKVEALRFTKGLNSTVKKPDVDGLNLKKYWVGETGGDKQDF